MSKKRFLTAVLVVILLGAIGLVSLYMTLGRMNALLKSRGGAHASGGSPHASEVHESLAAQGLEKMTLTPAGEAQLRESVVKAQPTSESDGSMAGTAPGASKAGPPARTPPPAKSAR